MKVAESHSEGQATEVASKPRRKARRSMSFADYVTERDRAILVLQNHDFSTEEVAAVLQISVRLVELRRGRLQRIKVELIRRRKAADDSL